MGNCQASEVATVVIQHPGGRVERLYWPTSAADVMKTNPGYHVALVSLYVSEEKQDGSSVRFTRVKLLKPKDMLLLGQVYRLITSQGPNLFFLLQTKKQHTDGSERQAMASFASEHLRDGKLIVQFSYPVVTTKRQTAIVTVHLNKPFLDRKNCEPNLAIIFNFNSPGWIKILIQATLHGLLPSFGISALWEQSPHDAIAFLLESPPPSLPLLTMKLYVSSTTSLNLTTDPISVQLLGVVLWRRCIPLASSTSSLAAGQGTSNDARGRTRRPELCWLDAFRPSLIMPLSSPS
ncbi:unnamed protein product, partial [Musa acuminata subsp. burmannicoides]